MAVRLLIKNIANAWSTGDVIAACESDHVFGRYESKTNFVNSGLNANDWPRQFVIVNVSDASEDDYSYLLENNESGRRYYISPQGEESPYYPQLIEHAEITTTKAILNTLIQDRGE